MLIVKIYFKMYNITIAHDTCITNVSLKSDTLIVICFKVNKESAELMVYQCMEIIKYFGIK